MRGVKTRALEKWKRLGIFLLLLLTVLVLINSVRKVYNKKENAEEALVKMNKELQELEKRNNDLQDLQAKLNSGEGLEFELRKKFNVAKVGENIAIIIDQDKLPENNFFPGSIRQRIKDFWNFLFK